MFRFTDGILMLVEGDEPNTWYLAQNWQYKKFIEVMKFGTMKSMGIPNPLTESDTFRHGQYNYKFEIINDWGPVYLINTNTNKKRRIQYHIIENKDESKGHLNDKLKQTNISKF